METKFEDLLRLIADVRKNGVQGRLLDTVYAVVGCMIIVRDRVRDFTSNLPAGEMGVMSGDMPVDANESEAIEELAGAMNYSTTAGIFRDRNGGGRLIGSGFIRELLGGFLRDFLKDLDWSELITAIISAISTGNWAPIIGIIIGGITDPDPDTPAAAVVGEPEIDGESEEQVAAESTSEAASAQAGGGCCG